MSNLFYLALFLVFVANIIAIRVMRDRRLVIALFVFVIAVHAALVFSKRDAWPFSTVGAFLESGNDERPLSSPRFAGVDSSGHEHAIDSRAWSPVSGRTLATWWLMNRWKLTPAEKDAALAFLLRKAQSPHNRLAIAPNWYSVDPVPPPAPPPAAIRVLLITRIPKEKLANGTETSQQMAQFPR